MICCACKHTIEIHDFDLGNSFEAISPATFRKGNFHSECFELLVEVAKDTPSKKQDYGNRYDEYLTTKI